MKVGDYVAKITNEWQKHNKWMEFPDELPVPLGIIVGKGHRPTGGVERWLVLVPDGSLIEYSENHIKIIENS